MRSCGAHKQKATDLACALSPIAPPPPTSPGRDLACVRCPECKGRFLLKDGRELRVLRCPECRFYLCK
eukprot:gene35450-15081_t